MLWQGRLVSRAEPQRQSDAGGMQAMLPSAPRARAVGGLSRGRTLARRSFNRRLGLKDAAPILLSDATAIGRP